METQLYTRSEPAMLPHFPRLIYLTLLEDGHSEQQILGGLDISAAQLQDETYRLSIEQHERFILRLLELANDPHFTLRLWKNYDPTSANIFLLAVANSGQISKALHLVTRYSKIFTRTFSIRSFETDEQVVMDIEPQLEHESVIYFALINFVLFLDSFFKKALTGAHLIGRVEMSIPMPEEFGEIADEVGVPVTFDRAQTRIYFNREFRDQPMKQADPQTVRLLQEMCERQLEEAESGLVGSVKSLLIDRIASPPKLDEAAKLLGLSSRGLRRKLEQSGTSYQKLLVSLRARISSRLLRETDEPVSSIATVFDPDTLKPVLYILMDSRRRAEFLGMPFLFPPKPDPIVQDMEKLQVAKEQPYIYRLCKLGVEAERRGKGLDFAAAVSRLIMGGTESWDQGDHLEKAVASVGLNLQELDETIADGDHLEEIERNHDGLEAAGHWGVPTMVLRDEPFFGQDRIDTLRWRLDQYGAKKN